MKLIDADKLKDEIAENYVSKRKKLKGWDKEALAVMDIVDRQSDVMVTCFKCHGKGKYDVPAFDDETFSPSLTEWESRPCEICHSTGKITLEFYEMLQRKMREKE